jgi:hypothetical protein
MPAKPLLRQQAENRNGAVPAMSFLTRPEAKFPPPTVITRPLSCDRVYKLKKPFRLAWSFNEAALEDGLSMAPLIGRIMDIAPDQSSVVSAALTVASGRTCCGRGLAPASYKANEKQQ